MTHHAAALTYYALVSLFPAVLLALSLLGLLGQYPETYNAIIGYLREVAPASVVDPLDSVRGPSANRARPVRVAAARRRAERTSTAVATAPGHRAMLQTRAVVEPSPAEIEREQEHVPLQDWPGSAARRAASTAGNAQPARAGAACEAGSTRATSSNTDRRRRNLRSRSCMALTVSA